MSGRTLRWIAGLGTGAFLLVVLVGFVVVSVSFYAYNESDSFCLQCHFKEGLLSPAVVTAPAHEPYEMGTKACTDCHQERQILIHLERAGRRMQENLAWFTQLDRVEPLPSGTSDEACMACHHRILEINRMPENEMVLTPELAKIGLRFDHARHYGLKDFTDADVARLAELDEKAAAAGLVEDEEDERAFLAKVRRSRCSLCHEKWKEGAERVDKAVNYFTAGPMTCFSCHPDADAAIHPGNALSIPTERVCRRCHNGKIHGRIFFFNADKNDPDKSTCNMCHPAYVATGTAFD